MNYISTRSKSEGVSSAVAIKQGLASDGGLFVPEKIPEISEKDLAKYQKMSYNERAIDIFSRYLTDFSKEEIENCVNKAYNVKNFATKTITPLYRLNDQVYFLELWHGPTCAFKDVALQILPHFLTTSMKKTGEDNTVVILVATSGDTGKAALEGFKDIEGTKIVVFYPQDGVSEIQKLQMTTQEGENVCVSGIIGNFDDAQTGVKAIFTDKEYMAKLEKSKMKLSSANSINWGRLLPQIVYYFSSYAELVENEQIAMGDKINFVVPTGNFGDILAGYYAYLMGLPVNKFICASNKNNVLTDFINTGIYNKNRDFYATNSPSMDILISSNLERFLHNITGCDYARVKSFMEDLSTQGKYEVPDVTKSRIKDIMYGGYCDEADTKLTIKDTFQAYGYIMDTHTAVAKNVYDQYRFETSDTTKTVILSTASPFKFNRSVMESLEGEESIKGVDEFTLLNNLSAITGVKVPNSLGKLEGKTVRFGENINKNNMAKFVDEFLGV